MSGDLNTDSKAAGDGQPAVSLSEIAEASAAVGVIDSMLEPLGLDAKTPKYAAVRAGLVGLCEFVLRSGTEGHVVDRSLADLLIAEATSKLCNQIDEILHHPTFQAIESAWRSLKFVIDRAEFNENILVEMLNVSKQDLLEDFQDSPEIPKSGMYKVVYSVEYGQFGGKPYGFIVGNYEFDNSPRDVGLLSDCAAVAAMAHAPFIAAASSKFFGLDDFLLLPHLSEISAIFEAPQYTKWRAFRDTDDSRYLGLCLPRFLLRLPYGPNSVRVDAFEYEERVVGDHTAYLWGNAAFALATRVAEAFARYRWCLHIAGPSGGGTVEDLPLHEYETMGAIQTKIPTEVMITERREFQLAESGFIGFTYRRDTENACFFSVNSAQRPKTFSRNPEGYEAALNHKLGTQLPYLLITCRLAHYLKVMQREHIGSWKERKDLQAGLNSWIQQYVADMAAVTAAVRSRRPLRKAQVLVADVPGNAGWYRVDLRVRPHFKYMGAVFQMGLVGRLDSE